MRATWARLTVALIALALGAVLAAGPAAASGVQIVENNGRGLGNAYAGQAAAAEDASTVWWNPAGMTQIGRFQVVAAGAAIFPSGEFQDQGSFRFPLVPFTGASAVDGGETAFVPNLYAVLGVGSRLRFGLGLNAPFGLSTDYGETWIGRYYATNSELMVLNINPSVAYRVNQWVSIGAGFDIQYADATLKNAIDFGALLDPLLAQTLDGQVSLEADDWSFGFNAGIIVEPRCGTRVGIHYRSRVEHELEGDADFTVPPPAAPIVAATGRFVDTPARAKVEFPDSLSLSVYHEVNPCLALLADVTWTGWSTFDELRVQFDNPAEPDLVEPQDWDDSWRVSLGATYRPSPRWAIRVGLAYDQSPIPTATRTPRVPGNDRYWVAAGIGYQITPCVGVDVGYAHLFVDDGDINQASTARGFLIGATDNSVDILAAQLTVDF